MQKHYNLYKPAFLTNKYGFSKNVKELNHFTKNQNINKFKLKSIGKYPEAILFDCDGVLVDTERDGHRVAFNEAFKRKNLKHEWDIELYGKLLETGGGKERMFVYFSNYPNEEPFKSLENEEDCKSYLKELHLLKTEIFMEMIESGRMPLRPGIKKLISEAMSKDIPIAVCSTSNEKAVKRIVDVLLGPEISNKMKVYAGDIVLNKKPSPDIYLLAAREMNVNPINCIVIEDSEIGVEAAKAAGMKCIVTKSGYAYTEDFSKADAVFDCVGDLGDERFTINDLISKNIAM